MNIILNNLKQLSLTKIYTYWVAVNVLFTIIYTLTGGRFQEIMSPIVSKASPQLLAEISPEAMLTGITVIIVIVFLIMIGIGYFLVIYAEKGKRWAQWLFLLACLWLIRPSVFRSLDLNQLYSNLPLYGVVIGFLSWGIMVVLIVKVVLLLRKPQIQANQTL